jgi:predicted small metal-binding protein
VFLVVESGMKEEGPMPDDKKAKHIACGDVVAGCTFTASAATEEELIKQVVAHAAHDHGVTDVTPELAAKVQAAIKTR